MNDLKHLVGVDSPFFPEFLTEGIYVVEEEFAKSKNEILKTIEAKPDVPTITESVLPPLDKPILVLLQLADDGQNFTTMRNFLYKVLESAKISTKDVDVLQMAKFKDLTPRYVIEKSPATKILTFGLDKINPNHFEIKNFNGKEILIAAPIDSIYKDVTFKKNLWELLKKMFGIN